MTIDSERLLRELQHLATFTEPASPGAQQPGDTAVTRVVFSPEDLAARAYLRQLATEAGLAIREDAVGNTFFRWQGADAALAPVATGSHIDAIPNAGMYDGTVGVLGGLEAIRALQASGFQPQRSIELILFTSEEPTRFGIGCLGSRLMSGTLSGSQAAELRDNAGTTLDETRAAAGFDGDLASVRVAPGAYAHFVELHIEQGPLLERDSLQIGLVTAITAPASSTITIKGQGGHAGAMLMPDRRDALAAAAEVILAVEKAARTSGALDTVATVGICDVFPGAVNSVPSRVWLSLDVRDIDEQRRNDTLTTIESSAALIAFERKVSITFEHLNADPPAPCSPEILAAIEKSCKEAGLTHRSMVSRAYHDSLFMARLCPVAMIFIPCRGGVSHRPDEYSSPAALADGVAVLARTLAQLSQA